MSSVASIVNYALRGVRRADGWLNVITGVGNRLVDTVPTEFRRLNDNVLSSLFHADATARKACEMRPQAALRRGITFTLPKDSGGAELSTKVMDEFERLDAINVTRLAATWENLYGGSAVWVGLDDGHFGHDSQLMPVDTARIQRVLFFKELDRRYIYPDYTSSYINRDPMSPSFGKPEFYIIDAGDGVQVRVHRDRLIIFPGITTTQDYRQSWNGWGVSALDIAWASLQRHAMVWGSSANAVANAQYVIYKLKGLAHMFSAKEGEQKAKSRAKAMEMAKSMINAVMIDADDDYIRENPNFGNLPEMIDRFMCDVAHSLDIPVTKLFGRSPAGENSTGEHDENNWIESCESYQTHHLRMRMHRMCEFIVAAKEGPFRGVDPGGWKVTFPPMRQLSEAEWADVRLKQAQTDEIYITAQVATANEIAQSRFRAEGYSTETTVDLEMRERLAEGDEDELVAKAEASLATHEATAENPLGVTPEDKAGGKKKPAAKKKTGD
jgi:phage-related protein (TIGR01555 family)